MIHTYAFLDPGSSATFCSESLMQELNVRGRRANFLLRTMGQEKVVPTYTLTGLEVSGLNSECYYQLPNVLTQREMPVTSDNIITQEGLARWSYLSAIQIPCIKANVDLLIGSNAPKLLEPWDVVNSCGGGPYAIKTVLGWVINGPMQGGDTANPGIRLAVAAVNRISVCQLSELLNNQYLHGFNERTYEDKEMSREDARFLEIESHSAKLLDGHYILKMPFRKGQPMLPNNLTMAKQRILGLKRRFERNEQFHQEYASFFTDVISSGYAEKVPRHQLDCEEGKVWYWSAYKVQAGAVGFDGRHTEDVLSG